MRSGDEVRLRFNTLYNNINSGASPGINDYEISLFLTSAQYEVYDSYATGTPLKSISFEDNERVRKMLSIKTKHASVNTLNLSLTPSTNKFNCYFLTLTNNVWRVVWERAVLRSSDSCLNGNEVVVKPMTHDEFDTLMENPFKQPSESKVLRLDLNNGHELISKETLSGYKYRYLEKPSPWIISNLSEMQVELGYVPTVDGEYNTSPCVFDNFLEDIIISRAVELATLSYKENSLNTQLPMNSRVE